jgi:adenosine 3'-phospho 5'-phosphosulfate transporter B3
MLTHMKACEMDNRAGANAVSNPESIRTFIVLSLSTVLLIGASCYIEELLLKFSEGFRWYWTTTFVELLAFAASSYASVRLTGKVDDGVYPPTAPIQLYLVSGATLSLYAGFGKIAFKFVNYATGTALKSMKLVPVMIISTCWLRRTYDTYDYVAALLLVSSAVLFGIGERTVDVESDYTIGLFFSLTCLGLTAIQSNITEMCLKDYNASVNENMFYANGIGAALVFPILATTEGSRMVIYFVSHPSSFLLVILRSLLFFGGGWMYTLLVKRYGAVVAVGVTSARKGLSLILSFLFFPADKPWSTSFALALVCFLGAVVTESLKVVHRFRADKSDQLATHTNIKKHRKYFLIPSFSDNGAKHLKRFAAAILLAYTLTCFLLLQAESRWSHYSLLHNMKKFDDEPLDGTIWSSDFHISPPADIKGLLKTWTETMKITIIDESISGDCPRTHTCASDLQVLNHANGLTLGDCPNEMKRLFWKTYNSAPYNFSNVDAFLFTYSTPLSELFMAFGKPIIIVASVRYEVGRRDPARWEALNLNLRSIAADSRNTVAANNHYDFEYLKHFTGIKNIKLLQNDCAYVGAVYNRTSNVILIGPSRLSRPGLELVKGETGLLKTLSQHVTMFPELNFSMIRDLYSNFEYADIASHPAVVIIPYANSVMSVMEYYRMGIPIFAPSVELLTTWQTSSLLLNELSWSCLSRNCVGPSIIGPHPDTPHPGTDPSNLTDVRNMRHWLKFCDFFNWPAVQYFDSWDDLFRKVSDADFDTIHFEMMEFNAIKTKAIKDTWLDVLSRAFERPRENPTNFDTWEAAMKHFHPTLPENLLDEKC